MTQAWSFSLVQRTTLGGSPYRGFLCTYRFPSPLCMVTQKPLALCWTIYDSSRVKASIRKERGWWRGSEPKKEYKGHCKTPVIKDAVKATAKISASAALHHRRKLVRRAHKMFCSLASALPRYHTTTIKGREEKNNLSSLNTFFQTPLNGIFSNYILLKAIDKLTQFPICPFIFFFPCAGKFWQVTAVGPGYWKGRRR